MPIPTHRRILSVQHIEIGQSWDIYSEKVRSWAPATVTAVEKDVVTLTYRDFPERCQVESRLMFQTRDLFRPHMPGT